MIGLDTNILVRFIMQDDPRQSAIANDVFERRLTPAEPGYLSVVAMVETAWVLERAYGRTSAEIAAAIERVLQIDMLVVEAEQAVFEAVTALRSGDGAFADALIGALNTRAGCERTFSFDRKALRLPGFEHP